MITNPDPARQGWATARTLAEALPYIQRYAGKTVVIKYGGHAMGDPALSRAFAGDVVLLKHLGVNPVVVHGGGPQIGAMLERLNIPSEFVDGLRVTDAAVMEVAEMVLSGLINKSIVQAVNAAGGRAVGLSGKDAGLIRATKAQRTVKDADSAIERALDLGFVGEPERIDATVLETLASARDAFIPVVAPVGVSEDGQTYNINADTVAGAVAAALKAERLMLLTDVVGVLDGERQLIRAISPDQVDELIDAEVAPGGMIPKLRTAQGAVRAGVGGAVILDGRPAHALLVEMFTEHGAGTLIG
ncbi:MAG: acetylglutamate kinase [Maricaulaceae bacterium]